MPPRRRRAARLRAPALFAVLALAGPAGACPVCDTGTGRQVRAGLFGPDFVPTLLAVAAPFPVLLLAAAFVLWGPPAPARRKRRT